MALMIFEMVEMWLKLLLGSSVMLGAIWLCWLAWNVRQARKLGRRLQAIEQSLKRLERHVRFYKRSGQKRGQHGTS